MADDKPEPPTPTSTNTPLGPRGVWVLTTYLLLAALLSCWLLLSLWFAKPKAEAEPAPQPQKDCAEPVASGLLPSIVTIATTESDFVVVGCGFTEQHTKVKINGNPHAAIVTDAHQITVPLTTADVASAGNFVVTVLNDDKEVGSKLLTVIPPTVEWHFPLWPGQPAISYEVQLLLMVLFVGAFASSIYALKSLADYKGDNKLYESWSIFYLIQPFEGAGAAFLTYLLIRGGFLTGTSVNAATENRYGMLAIAGLAGAFSDMAFLKLREVFQNLLKPTDTRGGKLSLEITTKSLPDGTVGKDYGPVVLQSERGTPPLTWSVSPGLPADLKLDAASGTISGTPKAVSAKSQYKFRVTDSSTPRVSSSADLTLEIKSEANDDLDGCDVAVEKSTSDEDLPASEGGVAK